MPIYVPCTLDYQSTNPKTYWLSWYQPPRSTTYSSTARALALPVLRTSSPSRARLLPMATPPSSSKVADAHSSVTSQAQAEVLAKRQAADLANAAAAEAQRVERERLAARDAALARAQEAEAEAVAAAEEHDAAAQRARDALDRAAQALTAAEAAAAPTGPPDPPPAGGAPSPDLRTAMLQHEAVALLQLHSQAVVVNNIRNHVTNVLDVDSSNFNRWCDQFLLILGKFSLRDNVREEPPVPMSPDWDRMDCVVKAWIIATLTDDLAEIISA